MKCVSLSIEDVKIIEPEIIKDSRGSLSIIFSSFDYQMLGIPFKMKQINQSHSILKNTIHGLHYQENPYSQAKLISCSRGSFYSVAVDLRENSKTFGAWCGEYISSKNQRIMYLPKGFAHGYVSLEDDTLLQYCVDEAYNKNAAKVIRFDDPHLNIIWPVKKNDIIISEKDINGLSFDCLKNEK